MYELSGGNVGARTTSEYSDYVMLVMNSRAMGSILSGQEVHFGTDVSVAAGPTSTPGRGSERLADVITYAQSGSVLSGASLAGSILTPDQKANQKFYGASSTPEEIAAKEAIEAPRAGWPLVTWLNRQLPPRNS